MTVDDDHVEPAASVPGPQVREDRSGATPPGPEGGLVGGANGIPSPIGLGPAKKRRRWPWVIFIVLVVAIAVASRINLNYYFLQPGTAQSVQQFITVPADKGHPVTHPVLLTDVELGRVNALSYLWFKLQGHTSLEQVDDVTGGTPPAQLNAQGNLEMSQAEAAAKAAALRHLGYKVPATAGGAVIFATFPGTPAYPVVNVGDVITAIDGTATPTAAALSTVLDRHHSGQTVTLTVLRGGTGRPVPVSVTLKRTVIDIAGQTSTVTLGVDAQDEVDFTYPFPVSINVTNIGGPSAGLAMTLGVIDVLDSGSLTGGHTVAATGTINAQGDVGDVGGVAQKTIAVENAGATIFFVPPQEYKAAMSEDRPGLKVYAVSTLDQVLKILAAHGGSVPKVPATP
jgi:PDZ domain-containing protein